MKSSLLRPKSDQSRHEERSLLDASMRLTSAGLKRKFAPGKLVAIPNEQRATPSGLILASTLRDMAIVPLSFVLTYSFNSLNQANLAALNEKVAGVSNVFNSVNW